MKIDIVVFDNVEEQKLEQFIDKHNLAYDTAYNRAEDYIEYNGIEISEKLYTILLLLENNWHIEQSEGAVGEQ
jgi:hypothetical protein